MSVDTRVRYKNCPLIEVTYQVNFPAILSIEAEEPVGFQKRIMVKYPNYEQQTEYQNEVTFNVENEKGLANAVLNNKQLRKLHLFVSEDRNWKITLAKDMLAFSTTEYQYWEDMAERAADIIHSLEEEYHPMYYNRVGIRYIDAFDRQKLGLEDVDWGALLQPHICGCLSYKTDGNLLIRQANVNSELAINDIFIKLASGTGTIDYHDGSQPHEAFIFNCDYYYPNKTTVETREEIADKLHVTSNKFFRDAISDKLHFAMKPEALKK